MPRAKRTYAIFVCLVSGRSPEEKLGLVQKQRKYRYPSEFAPQVIQTHYLYFDNQDCFQYHVLIAFITSELLYFYKETFIYQYRPAVCHSKSMQKQVVTTKLISYSENTLTICLSCQGPVAKLELYFI